MVYPTGKLFQVGQYACQSMEARIWAKLIETSFAIKSTIAK
jgi:hypothetical protein